MKLKNKTKLRPAFTIIEILTIMSIIVLLMGLLVPALNMVKRHAKVVKQRAQFNAISVALEQFNTEQDGYPESEAMPLDGSTPMTTGAQRLAEALVGRDLWGFDPVSSGDHYAERNPQDGSDPYFYNSNDPGVNDSLDRRIGPYLEMDGVDAYNIIELYQTTGSVYTPPDGNSVSSPVLCDIYRVTRVRKGHNAGARVGSPILYYKADLSGRTTDAIYKHADNQALINLGAFLNNEVTGSKVHMWDSGLNPGDTAEGTGKNGFYKFIWNPQFPLDTSSTGYGRYTGSYPYNAKKYILISAGFDGIFGTEDDVTNFRN